VFDFEDNVVILERGKSTDAVPTEYQVAIVIGSEVFTTQPVKSRDRADQIRSRCIQKLKKNFGIETNNDPDSLQIFEDEYVVEINGNDVGLTLTEFELFNYLVKHEGKALTRQQLVESVW